MYCNTSTQTGTVKLVLYRHRNFHKENNSIICDLKQFCRDSTYCFKNICISKIKTQNYNIVNSTMDAYKFTALIKQQHSKNNI